MSISGPSDHPLYTSSSQVRGLSSSTHGKLAPTLLPAQSLPESLKETDNKSSENQTAVNPLQTEFKSVLSLYVPHELQQSAASRSCQLLPSETSTSDSMNKNAVIDQTFTKDHLASHMAALPLIGCLPLIQEDHQI